MKVRITLEARADLADLVAWIGRENPRAAVRYGDRLTTKALQIGDMPLAFAVIEQRPDGDLRKRSHRNHVIIYRVTEEVEILRILDARRDYIPLLEAL